MTWIDALQIGTVVIGSIGGGGVIVFGLSRFLGDIWLQQWKGGIDAKLARLEFALEHRNYVLQRLAEHELEALTTCWRAARACLPLMNATRPHDSGTNEDVLRENVEALGDAHNALIAAVGQHEVHLDKASVAILDELSRIIRGELSNIRYHPHFQGSWWEEGEKNSADFCQQCDVLQEVVRERIGQLRAQSAEA